MGYLYNVKVSSDKLLITKGKSDSTDTALTMINLGLIKKGQIDIRASSYSPQRRTNYLSHL